MIDPNYIINHTGPLKSETIDLLISQFKDEKEKRGISINAFKKIIAIMIESLENIFKYTKFFESHHEALSFPDASFQIIALADNKFQIIAANAIHTNEAYKLKDKLEGLKKMNEEQLKGLYLETIKNGQFSLQGGAGLGFIKIARVTECNIDFEFTPINENLVNFTFSATIE